MNDMTTTTGNGGETHQRAAGDAPVLTTNHGVPIGDNQNSLKSGARGPTLLEDFVLREKIFHFDHERIPERIVHARGSGAHGVFEATEVLAKHDENYMPPEAAAALKQAHSRGQAGTLVVPGAGGKR